MGIIQRIVSAGIVASIFIILANIFNKRAIGDAWEQLQVTVVKKYLSSSSLDDHDIHNVVYEVLWHGSPVTTDNVVDWQEYESVSEGDVLTRYVQPSPLSKLDKQTPLSVKSDDIPKLKKMDKFYSNFFVVCGIFTFIYLILTGAGTG